MRWVSLLGDDAIGRHLHTLTDVDIVRKREFEQGERLREWPYEFYELTEKARR